MYAHANWICFYNLLTKSGCHFHIWLVAVRTLFIWTNNLDFIFSHLGPFIIHNFVKPRNLSFIWFRKHGFDNFVGLFICFPMGCGWILHVLFFSCYKIWCNCNFYIVLKQFARPEKAHQLGQIFFFPLLFKRLNCIFGPRSLRCVACWSSKL